MERVSFIIDKLHQLMEDKASVEILLANAQLLVSELQQVQQESEPRSISVTIPKRNFVVEETPKLEESIIQPEEIVMGIPTLISTPLKEASFEPIELVVENEEKPSLQEPYLLNTIEEIPETEITREEYVLTLPEEEPEVVTPHLSQIEPTLNSAFFNSTDIPTLPQAAEAKLEMNELLAKEHNEINDRFKEDKAEVAHLHDTAQIRDLKRAISINEKYLFINNLFGKNEELYDKSIKHIQNFGILAEASFWIQKELKTKLGWSESDEVVQLFDQFVKRRFS
jgi:hypothetical protein